MNTKIEFITALLPHAIEAIGSQHSFLVRWGIGKASVECGWNLENELIVRANNCLGIQGGMWGSNGWTAFATIPVIWLKANTGSEAGEKIPWRVFPLGLTECFGELVRMWNDRTPYTPWRTVAVTSFEQIYAEGTAGHSMSVLKNIQNVLDEMIGADLVDAKGRLNQS